MRQIIKLIIISIISISIAGCGESKDKNDAKKDDAKEKKINLEKFIVGKWKITGFRCKSTGKCEQNLNNERVRMTFTDDGKYFETKSVEMKYRVEGKNVTIESKKKTRSLKIGLAFEITYTKGDEMLVLWNYQKNWGIYTKYIRKMDTDEPEKK